MNQLSAPLFRALLNHKNMNSSSFHVPGHKSGMIFPDLGENVFSAILKIDMTELTGLDHLHSPHGPINEAQQLLTHFYGAKDSYFLVGGSTSGNLSMILAIGKPGDRVLVQKNSHQSVFHGLHLAGLNPIFINPIIEPEGQIPVGLSFDKIKSVINKNSDIKAIILTYPNYFGMAIGEIGRVIDYAHQLNIPVLVDEAHGAHFRLSGFPDSTLQLGADVVVQSAHKTLPAMTMGSFLHFNSDRLNRQKLEFYLRAFQSSSPSYPIMASLDLARYYIANLTIEEIALIKESAQQFRTALSSIPQIKVLQENDNVYQVDPLKITVQTRCTLSGYELQQRFEQCGVFTELADSFHVLFVLPLGIYQKADQIVHLLKMKLATVPLRAFLPIKITPQLTETTELALSFAEMKERERTTVQVQNAQGKIAAENIIPYPPGIPIVMEGEIITKHHLDLIGLLSESGAHFIGVGNGIQVFKGKKG